MVVMLQCYNCTDVTLVHVALSKLSGLVVLLPTAPAPLHPGKICATSVAYQLS